MGAPDVSSPAVTEAMTARLVSWILGVGSVVTGGLLLWVGSTTFQLAQQSAVANEQLRLLREQQMRQTATATDTGRAVRELSLRVQRIEDSMERDRRSRD